MARPRAGEFFGDTECRLCSGGATASLLTHRCAQRLPAHGHSAPYFSLLVRGDYREQIDRRTFDYAPLTLMYYPPDLHHRDEVGPRGATFFTLELSAELLGRAGVDAAGSPAPSRVEGVESLFALRAYHALFDGRLSALALESLALELVARAWRIRETRDRSPAWMARVEQRLRDGIAEPRSVAELAAEAGVHPVHLARTFRRRHGMTIAEWVAERRLGRAASMLAEGRPLAEVALKLGFADQSHFTRVFGRHLGTSPGKLRARLRSSHTRRAPD